MTRTRIVVALGGNALLLRGEAAEAETQRRNVLEAASALAALATDHELVITHGNGPQVGLLALEAEAYKGVSPYPLDLLGAESQGMIGYLIANALRNELPDREVVALLTEVVVDEGDPAFRTPTKRVGPVYSEREARSLAWEHGWRIARDGPYFRRVVPSPAPKTIVELDSIERLVASGAVVVCAGGGGIPVARNGRLRGVEAIVDKDLTAAMLAEELGAVRLVLATDVAFVERDWGTASATRIVSATPSLLRRSDFAADSMGPKVEAACRFVERTGGEAAIGALGNLRMLARGTAGTQVHPDGFALPAP
jgi:carbamate kinase